MCTCFLLDVKCLTSNDTKVTVVKKLNSFTCTKNHKFSFVLMYKSDQKCYMRINDFIYKNY